MQRYSTSPFGTRYAFASGLALFLPLSLALAAPAAAVYRVVVYHSPSDDGSRPTAPPRIASGETQTLHLYMDEADGSANEPAKGEACRGGNSDERCGWDVALETEGAVEVQGFTPKGDVICSLTAARVRCNGGDPNAGEVGATKLGELRVLGSGEGNVVVRSGLTISNRMQKVPLVTGTVATVPEPGGRLAGGAVLGLLGILRRARRRGRWTRRGRDLGWLALALLLAARPDVAGAAYVDDGVEAFELSRGGSRLYWHTRCGTEFVPPESRFASRTTSRWATRLELAEHYTTAGCGGDRIESSRVATDWNFGYWLSADGRVLRSRMNLGPRDVELVAFMESLPTFGQAHIAVDDGRVYWTEGAKIFRALADGGTRSLVTTLTTGPVTDLQIGPRGGIYLLSGGGLYQLVYVTGGPFGDFWITQSVGPATAFAFFRADEVGIPSGQQQLIWADPSGPGGAALIRTRFLGSLVEGAPIALVGPALTIGVIAANSRYIYWSDGGPIRRGRRSGGSAEAITLDNFGLMPGQIAADADHVYYRDPSVGSYGGIVRLPVDGAVVTQDLEVTGLEIVQAIQKPDNSIELVADKPTYARLFGKIAASSTGETRFRPYPLAVLRGYRDGSELPESPVEPMARFSPDLLNGDPDRREDGSDIRFELPPSWTARGDIRFVAELNPGRVLPETSYGNNFASAEVRFHAKPATCGIVKPVLSPVGAIGSWRPRYERMFRRAEIMLPSPELRVYWPGGGAWEEYEFPFSSGPYELSKADDDSGWVLFRLVVHEIGRDDPQACDDENARTHQFVLVPFNHPDRALNGVASSNSLIVFETYGNDPSNSAANSAVGGVTLAHEIGHNRGRDHVDCPVGDPAGTDDDYPFPVCQLDSDSSVAGVGLDPISGLVLDPLEHADLLSYGHRASPAIPRWPSEYTWRGIFRDMGLRPALAAGLSEPLAGLAPEPVGSGGVATPKLVISGLLESDGFSATFDYAMPLDPQTESNLNELMARTRISPDHAIRVYDASGALIEQLAVHLIELSESLDEKGFVAATKGAGVPARIELVQVNAPLEPLGSLSAGMSAPTLSIQQPEAGDSVAGELSVRWTADDEDGDPLRFSVRYSADLGTTWSPQAWQTPFDRLDRSTRGLPGCAGTCLIEVTASDGLHSATLVSQPFSVVSDPIEVSIALEPSGEDVTDRSRSLGQTGGISLRGRAYSDELGPLSGDALSWQVSGREIHSGSGRILDLPDLAPGDYTVKLIADDGLGTPVSATSSLTLLPKFVPEAGAPFIDGLCDDLAYGEDEDPIRIVYPNGNVAELRMVRFEDQLVACLAGLPRSIFVLGFAGLRVDPDASGGAEPAVGDFEILVSELGQLGVFLANKQGIFESTLTPDGLYAQVALSESRWNVEIVLPDGALGSWGDTILAYPFERRSTLFADSWNGWPLSALPTVPDSWGAISLAPALELEIDVVPALIPNYVDTASEAHVWVAVLSTQYVDTTSEVDLDSVGFGPSAAKPDFSAAVDVNGDQAPDLLLRFPIPETGIADGDAQACLRGELLQEGGRFEDCDDIVTGCDPAECDPDDDGLPNREDFCPFHPGGAEDDGGLLSSKPDGIGNVCQCADWDDDGDIDFADPKALRKQLAEQPGASTLPEKCDVNDDGECDLLDVTIVRRALAGEGPGIRQTCDAAHN